MRASSSCCTSRRTSSRATRFRFADPYLLPIAGLLTAIGLTEIYRLNPDDAFRQGIWIVVAVVLFAATLFLLRHDYRRLETYKYLFGVSAIALLLLPILPVLGLTVNGARFGCAIGSLRFQPGELAKIMLIVFLAGYMREKREVLAQGRLKDWGPLLVIWVLAMLVLLETKDLGGGLLYFGIFLAMLYMATARIALRRRRARSVSRRRRGSVEGDAARAGAA